MRRTPADRPRSWALSVRGSDTRWFEIGHDFLEAWITTQRIPAGIEAKRLPEPARNPGRNQKAAERIRLQPRAPQRRQPKRRPAAPHLGTFTVSEIDPAQLAKKKFASSSFSTNKRVSAPAPSRGKHKLAVSWSFSPRRGMSRRRCKVSGSARLPRSGYCVLSQRISPAASDRTLHANEASLTLPTPKKKASHFQRYSGNRCVKAIAREWGLAHEAASRC